LWVLGVWGGVAVLEESGRWGKGKWVQRGGVAIGTLDRWLRVVVSRDSQECLQPIFDEVDATVSAWRIAVQRHDHAVGHQTRTVGAAERHLKTVLGSLGLQRWRNLVTARAQIYTTRDGLDMIRARRIRADVEAALAHLVDVETSEAEHVAVAQQELEAVATRLVPFGHLAVVVSGCPMDQLQRMAIDRSRSLKNTRSGSASPSVSWIPIR
jgi:hypothetical protein